MRRESSGCQSLSIWPQAPAACASSLQACGKPPRNAVFGKGRECCIIFNVGLAAGFLADIVNNWKVIKTRHIAQPRCSPFEINVPRQSDADAAEAFYAQGFPHPVSHCQITADKCGSSYIRFAGNHVLRKQLPMR